MNKDMSILFAFMIILLVAVLFEGDGALPAMADAAKLAREQSQSQSTIASTDVSGEVESAPLASLSGLATLTPPQPPHSEPDPPFTQPEPLK